MGGAADGEGVTSPGAAAEGAATCKEEVGERSEDPLSFERVFDYPSKEQ